MKLKSLICLLAATVAALPVLAQSDAAAKAAKEPGAVVTASGLVFKSIKDGSGARLV